MNESLEGLSASMLPSIMRGAISLRIGEKVEVVSNEAKTNLLGLLMKLEVSEMSVFLSFPL